MSFTKSELISSIKDYTENTETSFVANIPTFIRLAEERILKSTQLNLFRKNATANATASNKYYAVPSDFLAPFSLSFQNSNGDKEFAEFKDVSFLQTYTPNSTTTGIPRYYASFDVSNFILAPTPNTTYVGELHYYYRPASLVVGGDDSTTWLSINAEIALLYGSLIEAYIFMKGEQDIMNMYNQKFQEALIGVKMLGEARETTDEYRIGKVVREKQ